MKKVLTLLLFGGLLSTCVFAQGVEREVDIFPEQVSIEHNDAVKKFSKDYVTAGQFSSGIGSFINSILQADQLAIINQFGNENIASITQSGSNNYAMINIVGDQNDIGIEQDGNWNAAGLTFIGDQNEFSLIQRGFLNVFKRVQVTDGYQGQYIQNGFSLGLEVRGTNGIPMSIEQTGQNMGILIENYN